MKRNTKERIETISFNSMESAHMFTDYIYKTIGIGFSIRQTDESVECYIPDCMYTKDGNIITVGTKVYHMDNSGNINEYKVEGINGTTKYAINTETGNSAMWIHSPLYVDKRALIKDNKKHLKKSNKKHIIKCLCIH